MYCTGTLIVGLKKYYLPQTPQQPLNVMMVKQVKYICTSSE